MDIMGWNNKKTYDNDTAILKSLPIPDVTEMFDYCSKELTG
jgi:hypothetical protein